MADDLTKTLERELAAERAAREKLETKVSQLRRALEDMFSGWLYIRRVHGDLYGVGWDRAEDKARAAPKDGDER